MTYANLNKELEAKTADLQNKIDILELQKIEMRMAFEKARAGKEKQLKDAHLIFFAKRREMVDTYNSLNKKYEQIKIDFEEELKVKDKIIK